MFGSIPLIVRYCALNINLVFFQILTKYSLVHVEFHKVIKLIKKNKLYEIFRKI